MRLNPLTTRTLASKYFGVGPKALATVNAADIYKGVVQQLALVHDTQKYQYKPQTAYSDLLLASQGGYAADFDRAIVEAALFSDAADWTRTFFRDYEDLVLFTDEAAANYWAMRQIEEQLVLNSTALSNVNVLRAVTDVLSFTDHVRQSMFLEVLQHSLLLAQTAEYRRDFLRSVEETLSLTHTQDYVREFLRNLETVLLLSHQTALNGDFIRALSHLLTLIDFSDATMEFIAAVEHTLAMVETVGKLTDFMRASSDAITFTSNSVVEKILGGGGTEFLEDETSVLAFIQSLASNFEFNRQGSSNVTFSQILTKLQNYALSDGRTLSFTSNATGTRQTACEKITWNQVGTTYWPNYQACIKNNVGRSGSETFNADRFTGVTAGSNMWRSAILVANGYLYAIPLSATKVLKINYSNNTAAEVGSTLTGTLKWAGGAIRFDGSILGCPWNATTVLEIITSNDTTNTFNSITGNTKYSCAVTNKEGNTYFIPFDATSVEYVANGSYNVSTLNTGITGGDKYVGACLGSGGLKIYCVPATATKVAVIDTGVAATKNDLGTDEIGNGKWHGAVMTEDGYMYGIPYNSTKVLKIDMGAETKSTFGSLTGTAKWAGGAYAMNQKIYCASWNASTYLAIDTTNDSTATVNSDASNTKWAGAATVPDGRVLFIPNDEDTIAAVTPDATNTPTANVILSPHWNNY